MNATANTITRRIRAKGRGWVFTPKSFLDVGSRATVDKTLSRLSQQNIIRRLDRGIYDYPKQHDKLGTLSPNIDDLANAIAARTGDKTFPSGAAAANYLGLSTQVPARPTYLTNGSSRTKKIAGRTIVLKHARIPIMNSISDKANFMLQALLYLGQNNIDDILIKRCSNILDDRDINDLKTVAPRVPGWLSDIILRIRHGQLCKAA